jgi:hypothetical protein
MNLNAQLTNQQEKVTELIAWGGTYKDVANRLFISLRTAENHVRVALFAFKCPCGTKVKKGENYVNKDDQSVCLECGLPARKLIPIAEYQLTHI